MHFEEFEGLPSRTNPMSLMEYQMAARMTAIYPGRGSMIGLMYAALGLNGEAGECAEKVKKLMREEEDLLVEHANDFTYGVSSSKPYPDLRKQQMVMELGDVMWYLSAMCDELGVTLEEVAAANIQKLKSRQQRNMLHGNGDTR